MRWVKNSVKRKVLGTFQETSSATESMLKSKIIEITLEVSQKLTFENGTKYVCSYSLQWLSKIASIRPFKNAYKTCVIWPISPKWPPGDLKLVTSVSMPQIQKSSKDDIQKSNFRRRSSIWVQWKSIWIDTQRLRVKIDTYFLSAKLLKIKKALCFRFQMDSRVAVKLHLHDNWASNGPHMAFQKHCKTQEQL